MSKTYQIKSSPKLFEKWQKLSSQCNGKTRFGMLIVQNDMKLTSEQLNEWYGHVGDEIKEIENHFSILIKELKDLRQETVEYIKKSNKE